jgi:hypothetical protein
VELRKAQKDASKTPHASLGSLGSLPMYAPGTSLAPTRGSPTSKTGHP